MNTKEEWARLILVLSMLLGVIAVVLVSSGNLKKMGAYEEPTALSDYGEKFIDYYHDNFDDDVVTQKKNKIQAKIDKVPVIISDKRKVVKKNGSAPERLVDAKGNVYHLEHIVTIKKKKSTLRPRKIAEIDRKDKNKGKLND